MVKMKQVSTKLPRGAPTTQHEGVSWAVVRQLLAKGGMPAEDLTDRFRAETGDESITTARMTVLDMMEAGEVKLDERGCLRLVKLSR